MKAKLVTLEQVSLLKKGDIIERYPSHGPSCDVFDESDKKHIDIYRIRSSNANNHMLVGNDRSFHTHVLFTR